MTGIMVSLCWAFGWPVTNGKDEKTIFFFLLKTCNFCCEKIAGLSKCTKPRRTGGALCGDVKALLFIIILPSPSEHTREKKNTFSQPWFSLTVPHKELVGWKILFHNLENVLYSTIWKVWQTWWLRKCLRWPMWRRTWRSTHCPTWGLAPLSCRVLAPGAFGNQIWQHALSVAVDHPKLWQIHN